MADEQADDTLSKQRRWQIEQCALGNCETCGQVRGPDGTGHHCRFHADAQTAAATRRRNEKKRVKP